MLRGRRNRLVQLDWGEAKTEGGDESTASGWGTLCHYADFGFSSDMGPVGRSQLEEWSEEEATGIIQVEMTR
jgi:hypothetical protein